MGCLHTDILQMKEPVFDYNASHAQRCSRASRRRTICMQVGVMACKQTHLITCAQQARGSAGSDIWKTRHWKLPCRWCRCSRSFHTHPSPCTCTKRPISAQCNVQGEFGLEVAVQLSQPAEIAAIAVLQSSPGTGEPLRRGHQGRGGVHETCLVAAPRQTMAFHN